ncbi:MAG TPA: hypothetical protein VGF60_17180 [Xanthobacteraceae bacterium]|jgi:hypothetical protein
MNGTEAGIVKTLERAGIRKIDHVLSVPAGAGTLRESHGQDG